MRLRSVIPGSALKLMPERVMPSTKILIIVVAVALVGLGAGLTIGTWQQVCRDCPSVAQIYAWEPKASTKLLSNDGELIAEIFQERRTPVEINTLPKYVPQAFVAVEDKRFYKHDGLDYRRIITAALRNML